MVTVGWRIHDDCYPIGVRLHAPTWELMIVAVPPEFARLREVRETDAGRWLKIGTCAAAEVYWAHRDGQVTLRVGLDGRDVEDEWDVAVTVPPAVVDEIASFAERRLQELLGPFSRARLGGRPVPDDLATMLVAQRSGTNGHLTDHVTFLEPGESHPLLDHSYLTESDRADPAIAANVAAIDAVARHIGFVATVHNGLVGYWLHPDEPTDRPPAVVKYDNEGQFSIMFGANLAEALVGDWACDRRKQFRRWAKRLAKLGLIVTARCEDDLDYPEVTVHPAKLHHQRYSAECVQHGLAPGGSGSRQVSAG